VEEALEKAEACGLGSSREVEQARRLRTELSRKKEVLTDIQAAMEVRHYHVVKYE
jgi:hypothetical protein